MSCKVLIAEDELNFAYAIMEMIPWQQYDFEVVGQAIHGKQALEMLKTQKVDMVLTDIDMPVMNGVELTRQIRKRYPDILVVILSAYDDFEYVRESLKLGAKDYILKDWIDKEDIIGKLQSIRKAQEAEDEGEYEKQKKRQEIVEWISGGKEPPSECTFTAAFSGKQFILFLFIGKAEFVLPETFPGTGIEFSFLWKAEKKIWAALYALEHAGQKGRLYEELQEIRKCVQSRGLPIRGIGCYDLPFFWNDLPEAYQKVRVTEEYFYFFPSSRLLLYTEIEGCEKNRNREFICQINDEARLDKPETVSGILKELKEEICVRKPEISFINKNYVRIYTWYRKKIAFPLEYSEELTFYDEVKERDSLKEKQDLVKKRVEEDWEKYIIHYHGKSNEILKSIHYIYENYNKDLNLRKIADAVGLNENYFSNLFKKETGENVTSFINRIRIERAKELLQQKSLKTYEIADAVGYQNATYFSQVFRKMTGMSVKEYRESH